MSFLHEWLLGISACALLVSFAEQLPLTDAMRKIVRFTGGLLLILSILQPISGAELDGLSFDLAGYEEAVEALKTELAGERERALSDGIAEQTQALRTKHPHSVCACAPLWIRNAPTACRCRSM